MTKRSRPSMHKIVDEDRISNLPCDILISIISLLNIQEATSTSILSTRWRHLHYYADCLKFPKLNRICSIDSCDKFPNYRSMIDRVLNSNRATRIKMFTVDLSDLEESMLDHVLTSNLIRSWNIHWARDMYDGKGGNFESCFEFAITKKAESIYLDGLHQHLHKGPFLRLPNTNGLDCLKDLYLCGIKLIGQDFEFLVSNCPSLQCLEIESSRELRNVSIVGHSKLKFVKLSNIIPLESIVICDAISLVSLKLHRLYWECAVQLSNVPKLTELDFQESHNKVLLTGLLSGISSGIRDQLRLMRLSTSYFLKTFQLDIQWIDLVNVKRLELVIDMMKYTGDQWPFFHYLCGLVESCGSLENLVIKFRHHDYEELDEDELEIVTRHLPGCELSLKYLELTGYMGSSWERELALYVINNATALQKLTVMPCNEDALAHACHDFRHFSFLVI